MLYTEKEAYDIIVKHLRRINADLNKITNQKDNEFTLNSLLTLNILLGYKGRDVNTPVYSLVRNNWEYFQSIGCSKYKTGVYNLSSRGVLKILSYFKYIIIDDYEEEIVEEKEESNIEDFIDIKTTKLLERKKQLEEEKNILDTKLAFLDNLIIQLRDLKTIDQVIANI